MPARIIDGDALWRSDKLSHVNPPSFRAEYANLIPLALADGTFECNARRVWADVYSYNRPDITVAAVEEILDEFEKVGLLTRQSDEKGKVWGFWVGIEKRLPSESTRERYKKGMSSVFNGVQNLTIESRQDHDNIVPRLDRIRLDKISKEADFRNLAVRYRRAFHVNLSHGNIQKEQYAKNCQEFGEDAVLEQFDSWAPENLWIKERKHTNGLRQFYDALPAMIEAGAAIAEDKQVEKQQETQTQNLIDAAITAGLQAGQEREKELLQKREEERILVDSLKADPSGLFGG